MQTNPYYTINTGEPRHVVGHAVSGAVAVAVVSSVKNSQEFKSGNIAKDVAIKKTIKETVQGGIATATAIGVANALGDPTKSIFQTLGTLAIGLGSIYVIEKNAEKVLDVTAGFYGLGKKDEK